MLKLNFLKHDGTDADHGIGRILIIILLGVGLLLLTVGGREKSEENTAYTPDEEARLAELCSSLSGVGKCRVFIAYEERTVSYSSRTEKVIVGVAVICEGGGNDSVKARLTSLIDSLYGIGANRIRIDRME